jgi:hypothetical protein
MLSLMHGLVICLTAAGTAQDAGLAEHSFRLDVESAVGFRKDGPEFVRLTDCVDLTGASGAWEAERPDEALWGPKGGVKAQGGDEYVTDYRRLSYAYVADRAADVGLWARVRQPDAARCVYANGHQWNSEKAFTEAGLDPKAEHTRWADKWHWVRLRGLRLEPGVHAVCLVYSWPGSPDTDRLAVAPEGQSPETQEPPARRCVPTEHRLESQSFRLPAARRLVAANVLGDVRGGVVEASVDDGKTWQPARDLDVPRAFRLRLAFGRDETPVGRAVAFEARVLADQTQYTVLDNGTVRLGLDLIAPGIFRMSGTSAGVPFCTPPSAEPLFALELKQRGKPWPEPRYWLYPKDGRPAAEPKLTDSRGELTYSFLDGTLTATVSLALGDGPESEWSLRIDNQSDWDVLTFSFPRVAGLKVGGSGYDDRWLNTNRYGPWVAGLQPEDRPYPHWGALGFVDLYDESAGVSFATRDPLVGGTSFQLRPMGYFTGETCRLEALKEHCVPAGTSRTWTYAVRLHEGDWHAAADAYGDWFRQTTGAADHLPDWARDSNGWIQTSCALSDATFKWPQLLDTYEMGRRMGLTHLQVWGQFGSNTCAALWWPSPKYGSAEEFAAANRSIRNLGGHVGYYLLYDRENRYNLIDTETFDGYLPRSRYPADVPQLTPEQLTQGSMVSDPEGKVTAWPTTEDEMRQFREGLARLLAEGKMTTWADTETWPKHSMVVMNPLDDGWRNWLELAAIGHYVRRWNADTVYEDVLGCGTVGRSFDLRRGDHGEIHNGEVELARRLAEAGRRADPSFVLIAEGKQELVTRWAMGMSSSAHYGWIDHAAHRYTHPDHILFLGGSNGGYQQMYENCELAYLYGSRFDLVHTGSLEDIRRLITFRVGLQRFATRARYRDTVGLRVEGADLEATRHDRFAEGTAAALVAVVNRGGLPGALSVDTAGVEGGGAFWILDDWTVQAASLQRLQDTWVKTAVPPNRVSALLLVAQAPPGEDLLGGVHPERTPDGYRARLWLANLTGQARSANVSLEGPGRPPEAEPITLQPWGVWTAEEEVAFAPDGADFGDTVLRVDDRPVGRNFLYPLLEDGSFEKDGTPVEGAPDGKCAVHFGPAEGWQGTHRTLNLVPGRRYRASVSARRTGTQGEMYGLVRMRDGSDQWHYANLTFPAEPLNAWIELSAEFPAPTTLREANLYLYNMHTQEAVDYDDLRVVMLP